MFNKRYYRPICMQAFGKEVVDQTVPERMTKTITYRPQNPGLTAELNRMAGTKATAVT